MNLDSIESLNEVRPAVYRAALKLRSLQKLCQLQLVSLQDLRSVFHSSGKEGTRLSVNHVQESLEELFRSISPELSAQALHAATEQTTRLLFTLFDRGQSGVVLLRSLHVALVSLCGDTLVAKQSALFDLAESYSEVLENEQSCISPAGLRVVLEDLSQVPAVVQESHVFGQAEAAVSSCFRGGNTSRVKEQDFTGWLESEPRLLLWLSTLHRLSVSEGVQHRVRCKVCKTFPISGLRYRCLRCLNVHLCQSCFLTERRSRRHKASHPVLEYCTQPSWKESVASLASSARFALLPRRNNQRETEMRIAPTARHSTDQQYRTTSAENSDTQTATETGLMETTAVVRAVESKALQTEEMEMSERETVILQNDLSVTKKTVKDLQRDKWLLEREFNVWRVAAQSEHDSLEDKCTELKSMMEDLSEQNHHLEEELLRVRHTLSLQDRCELRNGFSSFSNMPSLNKELAEKKFTEAESPHAFTEEEEEEEKEQNVFEDDSSEELADETNFETTENISTNLDDTDSVSLEECHSALKEQGDIEEEQNELLNVKELCESETEEELSELIQELRNSLSAYTTLGSGSQQKEMLVTAAEEVKGSISNLVNSVKSIGLT